MIEDRGQHILTLREAAAFLRTSRAHLSNLAAGKVKHVLPPPHSRVGRRLLFRRQALEKWLADLERAECGAEGGLKAG